MVSFKAGGREVIQGMKSLRYRSLSAFDAGCLRIIQNRSLCSTGLVDLSKFATEKEDARSKFPDEVRLRDLQLRKQYIATRTTFPESAQPFDGSSRVGAKDAIRKRLIYRSKQRGWLEVDLLLGSFASEYAAGFSDAEVAQYERILNMETLDIFKFISGQVPAPDELQSPIFERLKEYANKNPIGIASPKDYEKIKQKMSN